MRVFCLLCSASRAGAGPRRGASRGRRRSTSSPTRRRKDAYGKLIPAFQRTPAGKGVEFKQSYGASGDQARAVAAGQPADVVALSLAPDIDKLVKAGSSPTNWDANKYHGIVTDSVVVVRRPQGQPEAHQHLGRPDQARRPGAHAEPVHLGRRALERDRRLRRAARARARPTSRRSPT